MEAVNRQAYVRTAYRPGMASSLADRVREARRSAQLSQAALAKKVGVSQPTIADIESGKIKETAHIVKIALATRHSAYWLETNKGPKKMGVLEALALSQEEETAAAAFLEGFRKARSR